MLRITGRTWGITLVVGVLGALLGFGIDLALHTEGWAVVVASMGLCAGAAFAGALATPEAPRLATVEASAADSPAAELGAPTE
jgi:F0F1-type ATP synthase assembly protein I